jgi:hypothetical protein
MGSVISYKGKADTTPTLYYSSPYSNTSRINGTILASNDNGATFSRSLNIWPSNVSQLHRPDLLRLYKPMGVIAVRVFLSGSPLLVL